MARKVVEDVGGWDQIEAIGVELHVLCDCAAGDGRFEVALVWSSSAFFVRTFDREARLSRDEPSPVSLASLAFTEREKTRGPVEESYRANLFALPFGKGFYEGFHVGKGRAAAGVGAQTRGPDEQGSLDGVGVQAGYMLSGPQVTAQPLQGIQRRDWVRRCVVSSCIA